MSTLAINPVEAEWLEAVYKITGTAKPTVVSGESNEENAKLKLKLEKQLVDVRKRLSELKGGRLPPLEGKLAIVAKDIESGYKLSAAEGRLSEIADKLTDLEKNGFPTDSKEWVTEMFSATTDFNKSCEEAKAELIKRAQQRAQALAKKESDPIRKKRLIAAGEEADVDFINVPINRIAEGFTLDLKLGGKDQKSKTVKQYNKELEETRTGIEKVIDGDRFAAVVRREQKPREQKREQKILKETSDGVSKKIEVLRELDTSRAKQYEDRLNNADTLKKITKIDTDIDGSIGRRQVDPLELAKKQEELDQKTEVVRKAKKSKKGDERAKLRDLQNGLKGAKALEETGNKKVSQAAEKLAEQMSNAASDPNVSQIFTNIDTLKKELGEKKLALFFAKEQAALLESLKKMGTEVDPLDIEPSQLALSAASIKVKSLTDQTAVRVKWQQTTKQKLGALNARIANVLDQGMFITGKAKQRGMVQKWKELRSSYMQPAAVMKDVDKELAKLQLQVDTLFAMKWKTPPDKAGLEKGLKADKAAGDKLTEKRKAEAKAISDLKSRKGKLEKALKTQKSRVKGDPALEDQIALAEELLKSATQLLKSRQVDEAVKKVDNAEEKITDSAKKEVGASDDTTEYLRDKAAIGWKNAVSKINQTIEGIMGDAVKLAKQEKADSGKVTKIIEGMQTQIFGEGVFATSFQGPINELIAAPAGNKKKAAREKVIVEIGYIRKQLESNDVLLQLRVNPFNKKISTTPLRAFLDELELNATKAVREK